jgi:hypothetical protein
MEGAVSRGRRLLVALGVGLALLAAVSIVAALSDALRFTPLCAGIGIVLVVLAVAAQMGLASPHFGEQPAAVRPFAHEATPVTGPTSSEQLPARRGSLFLFVVAAPCLIAAVISVVF